MSEQSKHPLIRVYPGEVIKVTPDLNPRFEDQYFEYLDSFPIHVVGIGKGVISIDRGVYEMPNPLSHSREPGRPILLPENCLFLTEPRITSSSLISKAERPEDLYPVFIKISFENLARTRAKDIRARLIYGDIAAESVNNARPPYLPGYRTDLHFNLWRDPGDKRSKYAYMPADPDKFGFLEIYIYRTQPSPLENLTTKPRVLRFPLERIQANT